jgi:hypothetical protein
MGTVSSKRNSRCKPHADLGNLLSIYECIPNYGRKQQVAVIVAAEGNSPARGKGYQYCDSCAYDLCQPD